MIFIDPLMETQLFKYMNASTEIIGPIVRYSCPILEHLTPLSNSGVKDRIDSKK